MSGVSKKRTVTLILKGRGPTFPQSRKCPRRRYEDVLVFAVLQDVKFFNTSSSKFKKNPSKSRMFANYFSGRGFQVASATHNSRTITKHWLRIIIAHLLNPLCITVKKSYFFVFFFVFF